MLHPVTNSLGQQAGAFARDGSAPMGFAPMGFAPMGFATVGLAAWLALAGCATAFADEPAERVEDMATSAEGDGPEDGHAGDLNEWARSVIDEALERSGADARRIAQTGSVPMGSASPGTARGAVPENDGESTTPLPAERHAGRIAEGFSARGSAEVLVFLSLAVPEASWAQWAYEAARAGAPLVLRGVSREGLRATAAEVRRRLAGHEAGVAVDPRLFTLFRVERVPAVAVVPGGVPPCEAPGCADDAPPPFDAVRGNIGLAAALEAGASDGEAGREAARRHLERLRRRP